MNIEFVAVIAEWCNRDENYQNRNHTETKMRKSMEIVEI